VKLGPGDSGSRRSAGEGLYYIGRADDPEDGLAIWAANCSIAQEQGAARLETLPEAITMVELIPAARADVLVYAAERLIESAGTSSVPHILALIKEAELHWSGALKLGVTGSVEDRS
jgi:hypothetical protein